MSVIEALDDFIDATRKSNEWLSTPFDDQWRSDCELGDPFEQDGEAHIRWQPVLRGPREDFAGLENALEVEIHADIKAYYGRYWAASLPAAAPDGPVQLIFLWNPDDADRLIENLIGHAMACQRSKSALSIFFATTTEASEYFLTVRNDTGEVQLELPGRKPVRTVAPNLQSFLEELAPVPPS